MDAKKLFLWRERFEPMIKFQSFEVLKGHSRVGDGLFKVGQVK